MEDIGIVTNSSSNREEVMKVFSSENFRLSSITKENDLTHLKGVLLYFTHENWLPDAIDWMLLLKKEPQMFIWVLLPKVECKEKTILFQLGANYVFSFPEEKQLIPYTLSNTFACIENYHPQSQEDLEFTLIESDVSMIVGKQKTALTRREYQVLSLLAEKEDSTVTYEEFSETLYSNKEFTNPHEMRSYIANIVYHVREKLEKSHWTIQTTRQKGYRLVKN